MSFKTSKMEGKNERRYFEEIEYQLRKGFGNALVEATIDEDFDSTSGFHVNGEGSVSVRDYQGNDVTLRVVDGGYYPYSITRVNSSGTDAEVSIIRIY